MDTPREVMFDVFRKEWGISNKKLASAIVLNDSAANTISRQARINDRSSLSRYVVHVRPGEYFYGWIAPYETSLPKVMPLIKASSKPHANADMISVLAGEGAARMRASLDAYGDGSLYANMVARVNASSEINSANRAELLMTLFIVAGCSGNAREAAEYVLSLARDRMYGDPFRTEPNGSTIIGLPLDAPDTRLGLCRVENGSLKGAPHRLNVGDEGTEIGALSIAPDSISDVGRGVSRRHARIWRDEDDKWYIQGLGSTNGTVLARKSSGGEYVVVEPPRDKRPLDYIAQPVAIQAGDRLILAGTTEFSVVALPAED